VAEVSGVNFKQPVPDAQIKDILKVMDRFGVAVFRDTGLDDSGHVNFSRQLGALEKAPKFRGPNVPDRFSHSELFDAGNTDRDGNIYKEGSRRWWYNKGNALWHVDSSFNQHRSKYSLLLAHKIPSKGGNTEFSDSRSAYRDLPEEEKGKLRGLVAEHNLWHSRRLAAPQEYTEPTEYEKLAKPPAYHKLVQIAPDGKETIYIASHASRIIGLPLTEGQRLIQTMLKYCSQDNYVCSIEWQQVGDLIIWDNRQVMHRGTPFEDQSEVRDMRRTTVFDDGGESLGVEVSPESL